MRTQRRGHARCGGKQDDTVRLVDIGKDKENNERHQRYLSDDSAEPPLIADAVAAFSANNSRRHAVGPGLIPATSKVFAGILRFGTGPIFYKIPSPQSWSMPSAEGSHLRTRLVSKLIPPVPDVREYLREGMVPLKNRRVVFQCLAAFKPVSVGL